VSALVVLQQPTSYPVDLATAKNFLRVTIDNDDALIQTLIVAATGVVEAFTSRSIATKTYRQSLDSFPYYTDSIVSQMAYPPSYYSLPRYSTTLWNYSQMIKLFAPPLLSIEEIAYLDSQTGERQVLDSSRYIVDSDSEPARLFPGPAGAIWPSVLYVPNAVQITFVAGYETPPSTASGVPDGIVVAILMLVANYYENREAAQPGAFSQIPNHIQNLLWAHRVIDAQPTRG
jgi:uncharacterized phiE125 gp8 family phage protein